MDYLKEIEKCQWALYMCKNLDMSERKKKKVIKLSKKICRLCQKEAKQWRD